MATPVRDRKTNFRLIIYPENLAKIGPVDFEIIVLTEIVKTKQETATEHKKPAVSAFSSQVG